MQEYISHETEGTGAARNQDFWREVRWNIRQPTAVGMPSLSLVFVEQHRYTACV